MLDLSTVNWIHGGPDCRQSADPPIQEVQANDNTFVFRLSKCSSFEAPFLYLLAGRDRVFLLDSGARPDNGSELPVREVVDRILRVALSGRDAGLIVAHTHAHRDHVSGDSQFHGRPRTTIVPPTLDGVRASYGFAHWPEGEATLDLGGRVLTVLPMPGHEESHIAVYDSATRILFTGDTLYPGLLTVRDWLNYVLSAQRLSAFANARHASMLLGAHIEMKRTPRELYPVGTTFQPDEHPLPLGIDVLNEWASACLAMRDAPRRDVHRDFIIEPEP